MRPSVFRTRQVEHLAFENSVRPLQLPMGYLGLGQRGKQRYRTYPSRPLKDDLNVRRFENCQDESGNFGAHFSPSRWVANFN